MNKEYITMNKGNSVFDSASSTYIYKFPKTTHFKDMQISLRSISMVYSWYNISAELGNSRIDYTIPDVGAVNTETTHQITIPDGFYTVEDLDQYLKFKLVENGHYNVLVGGDLWYPIILDYNKVFFKVEFTLTNLPSAGDPAYTTINISNDNNNTARVIIPVGFGKIIGFSAGQYPATIQTYPVGGVVFSSNTDIEAPITNVSLSTNFIKNNTQDNEILYTFLPNVNFGTYLEITPNYEVYTKFLDGNYNELRVQFLNQDGGLIAIRDPDISITFIILKNDKELN